MRTPRSLFLLLTGLCIGTLSARQWVGAPQGSHPAGTAATARAAACSPAAGKNDLDLNNVRARVETGGNMWQDRETNSPAYEVPKAGNNYSDGPNSIYSGALWMGGRSLDNQLKLAAVTYRTTGNDFWPGPLTKVDTINHTGGDASVSSAVCTQYDQTWKTMRKDAELQAAYYHCLADPQCNSDLEW